VPPITAREYFLLSVNIEVLKRVEIHVEWSISDLFLSLMVATTQYVLVGLGWARKAQKGCFLGMGWNTVISVNLPLFCMYI